MQLADSLAIEVAHRRHAADRSQWPPRPAWHVCGTDRSWFGHLTWGNAWSYGGEAISAAECSLPGRPYESHERFAVATLPEGAWSRIRHRRIRRRSLGHRNLCPGRGQVRVRIPLDGSADLPAHGVGS